MSSNFDDWQRGLSDRDAALQRALEYAYGTALRLDSVDYNNERLTFTFSRELKNVDEAWRYLFGVGMNAAADPSAQAWFREHPEMEIVATNCYHSGDSFVITDGVAFAFAQVKSIVKMQMPTLAQLARTVNDNPLTREQKSFAPCFVRRFEAARYIPCLMEAARTRWNRLTGEGLMIGGIARHGWDVFKLVKPLDRLRVLAVLTAWAQRGSYLDKQGFVRCLDYGPRNPEEATSSFCTEECVTVRIRVGDSQTARRLISMPLFHRGVYECVPTPGALATFAGVFESESGPERELREDFSIFGNSLGSTVPGIDRFFSALLEWDARHCYGLLLHLRSARLLSQQSNGELTTLEQAAWEWVWGQFRARRAPYAFYPLIDDEEHMLDHILDLEYGSQ